MMPARPTIAVLFLTRGRPGQLVAAVHAFHALCSDAARPLYVICGDDDDDTLPDALAMLFGLPVIPSINPRPDCLGRAWNLGALAALPHGWDIAMLTGDDTIPLAPAWDRRILQLHYGFGAHAFSAQEVGDPNNFTFPIVSRAWHHALGRIVPECFPYWFNDSWIAEVNQFAFGRPLPIEPGLPMGGRRGTTREMRDLAFWFRYFAHTRMQRVIEGQKIAASLGQSPPNPAPILRALDGWDRAQAYRVPVYEQAFEADTVSPTDRYRRAYDAAAASMAPVEPEAKPAPYFPSVKLPRWFPFYGATAEPRPTEDATP